jgi:uncharacterized protein (DUF1015 family)
MADIASFKAIRPIRDKVHLVATRPYYSYKKNVLKAKLQTNPFTFLRIINPEFGNKIKTKPNSNKRFEMVNDRYKEFIDKKILIQEESSRIYIYRQSKHEYSCVGVIAGASIEEYLNDKIKKHEATLTHREAMFTRYLKIVGYNAEPVLITYQGNKDINSHINELLKARPEYEFTTTDNIKHELWVLSEVETLEIQKLFKDIPSTYIADGHHRSASSARLLKNGQNTFPNSKYFLSYFVEEQQLTIIEFNRLLKSLNGLTKEEFIDKLHALGEIRELKEKVSPSQEHHINFCIDRQWYELKIQAALIDNSHPVKCLDSSLLTELILSPILGIHDIKTSDQIDFLPGSFSIDEFEDYFAKHKFKVGFLLYPIKIQQIKNVADYGLNMPPKSTWIEPKLRSGLTIYNIKE